MPITIPDDARKQAVASIQRFCADELEAEISEIQAAALLGFFLKELAPFAYNSGVADSQAFLLARIDDLGATCYEAEFAYWPRESSVRRKR